MGSSAVYESNGVPQADWIDDRGNLIHQWWNPPGGTWVVEIVAGPDGKTESKVPASREWGVTWILDTFGRPGVIELWTVSEDHSRAIHAWAGAGEAWHSEEWISPHPWETGDEAVVEAVEVDDDDGGRRRLRD